jgi:molecular chaperone GrpE
MEDTTQQTEEVNKNIEEQPDTAAEQVVAENIQSEKAADKSNETKLQADLAESKDKYLRLYSEFENFRRRTAKERLELIQSANEQLIKSLLPVIDDFERAEKAFNKEQPSVDMEGFSLIQNKLKKVLEQYGVKPMNVEKGTSFNPDLHEAITQIPAPEENLKGKIVDVVERGYMLNEKVIRYAKVVVGN